MAYNRESIWFHLYVAYCLRYVAPFVIYCLLEETAKMDLNEIFRRSTDGPGYLLARCWSPDDFSKMCREAGFCNVGYRGRYLNSLEPQLAKTYIAEALKDERVEEEHKVFFRRGQFDENDYPIKGEHMRCCIGGVYGL